MSASVFTLPAPLVLLIHLHLLQYPHANKPEYDHNLFDARVRGLRDRTRTMEDVSYFLITRIEGSKERARKIISTYPCVQPAETTAFRTSLAKFLETLRHSSMPSGRTDSKTPAANSAWWWKDVVVRKSLLEECAGEKFERLILALSTHALLKGSLPIDPKETQALLRSQPRAYMTHLATFRSARNAWARSASLLVQRQNDLRVLRFRVQHQNHSSKYDSLSTEKLRALADSTLQDLLSNAAWAGMGGRSALKFLADLSWIAPSDPADPKETQLVSEAPRDPLPPTPPPPLPIAAAHHPANLRKIIKRVFPKQVLVDTPSSAASKGPSRPHALSERMDAEARMGQALGDALARTRTSAARQKPIPSSRRALHRVKMNLWQATEQISNIDFEAAQDNGESFGALGPNTSTIEARVTAIRENLLPKYPPIPALPQPVTVTTPRQPPQTPPKSKSKIVSARRLVTKTSPPPKTVKPSLEHDLNRRLGPGQPVSSNSTVAIDRPLPAPFNPQREEYDAEGGESDLGTATPRPHPKQRQILTRRAPTSRSAAHTVALSAYAKPPYQFHDEEDSDDEFDEGTSMSVRDLLLQADMSHFDIIDDDSSEVGEQSFGWA
ncbi:hypothetical protein C8F04DRAFT_1095201 [Mycena alexandri]|uniref:HAUS augmin-like complex subunit 6 N-terminal domain-containing protein n=1 Tax=Mycena alexandri TaxID=1745969 RepID=A0AAD6X4S8_9AGAR|nr:hypothetical protein C8F04DRAFT_1095201 [Mycena alexandri]